MTEDVNAQYTETARGLASALDRHGYSFQHTVLREIREACQSSDLPWVFEVSEFPTVINDQSTRIDFLLRGRWDNFLLACECKRADPALSNWCFVKAPVVRRDRSRSVVVVDRIQKENGIILSGSHVWDEVTEVYHIGVEVRTGKTGDGSGTVRDAIEQSAAQVLKGVNGLAQLLRDQSQLLDAPWILGAVVFTTAKLWVSQTDISRADLATGKLRMEDVNAQPVDWVAYNYHLSPAIKHRIPTGTNVADLSHILGDHYIRTVMIVNADGINSFLHWTWN